MILVSHYLLLNKVFYVRPIFGKCRVGARTMLSKHLKHHILLFSFLIISFNRCTIYRIFANMVFLGEIGWTKFLGFFSKS
jgi:hypothetical protein